MFISDVSGTALHINRMYEQLTGLKQEGVQGRNVRALVEEGVFDHILNPEIVRTGKPATHVQQLKNGKKLVLSGFPVFDEAGGIRLVVTFARDITLLANLQEQVAGQCRLIDQINDQLAHMAHESRPQEPVFASPAMARGSFPVAAFRGHGRHDADSGRDRRGQGCLRAPGPQAERTQGLMLKVDCGGFRNPDRIRALRLSCPGASLPGASSKARRLF